jgi:hypothetical protein
MDHFIFYLFWHRNFLHRWSMLVMVKDRHSKDGAGDRSHPGHLLI